MPLIAMLAATAGGIGLANLMRHMTPAEQDYPRIPSSHDPDIWRAGTAAARAGRGASGRPDGMAWRPTSQYTAMMPRLIGT
jgi:hypothetical protein